MTNMDQLKTYYQLTKPGIIYGNVTTALAGFIFASQWHIQPWLLFWTIVGIAFSIGSACVFNNYIDRGIDEKMFRTKKRALVIGLISGRSALIFATILGIIGFSILTFFVNILTALIGLTGFVVYVILYGITKRHSIHGTLVGAVSGAMPIVAGYTAVTNQFDLAALLLFIILAAWQMPHFYAIAIYRIQDYTNAGIPVLPIKKGLFSTKIHIVLYILAFIIAVGLLTILRFIGFTFLIVMTLLGLVWLTMGIKGFFVKDDARWARKMFFFSLIIILSLSCMLAIGIVLP